MNTNLAQDALAVIALIKAGKLEQTYQGRVGCMCGCMGKYSQDAGVSKRRIKQVEALLTSGQLTEVDLSHSRLNATEYVYFAYQTDAGTNKCYCFYFAEEAAR